ncbi:FIG00773359: hypothetical protein [Leuconostoc gelidum subsp. gasicomitatum]|nr:FIG00773359: hypothetical protein [Leuconostoc gasicomitatum]
MRHEEVLREVGALKKEIVESAPENLLTAKYAQDIKNIYSALPQDMKGRWQVGNTTLNSGKVGRMAHANQLTNELLDTIFSKDLKTEYRGFKSLTKQYDEINIKDKGVMHKGQRKWSENKEDELRKCLANQLYRHLEQIDDISTLEIDTQMAESLKHVKQHEEDKPRKKKNLSQTDPENIAISDNVPRDKRYPQKGASFNKISRLWRQNILAENKAEQKFLQN